MSDSYAYLHLADANHNSADLAQELRSTSVRSWSERGVEVWGMFSGLFGLASNELIVILHNALGAPSSALTEPLRSAQILRTEQLRATVRPAAFTPLAQNGSDNKPGNESNKGLYVLRRFRLRPNSVPETVRLSRQAWETFEADSTFHTRPLGLFEQTEPNESHYDNMLLVTWYDGFDSWERSRKPAREAQDNFRQRHALTTRTGAIATRLLTSRAGQADKSG